MRRPWAACTIVVTVGLLAGCSGGGSTSATSPPTTPETSTTRPRNTVVTVATTPIPGPGTAPTSTIASAATTTIPIEPTSTEAPAPSTTAGGSGPACDAAVLQAAAEKAYGLPGGATLTEPRCAGGWASALVRASGQDSALAVFRAAGSGWEGANLGTDQVCSGAGVPAELYAALNCGPWDG